MYHVSNSLGVGKGNPENFWEIWGPSPWEEGVAYRSKRAPTSRVSPHQI